MVDERVEVRARTANRLVPVGRPGAIDLVGARRKRAATLLDVGGQTSNLFGVVRRNGHRTQILPSDLACCVGLGPRTPFFVDARESRVGLRPEAVPVEQQRVVVVIGRAHTLRVPVRWHACEVDLPGARQSLHSLRHGDGVDRRRRPGGSGGLVADEQATLFDIAVGDAVQRFHHTSRRLGEVTVADVGVPHLGVLRGRLLVVPRPVQGVGEIVVELVALWVVWVTLEVTAVCARRQLVLNPGVAAEFDVALLYALLAQTLSPVVVVDRGDDERVLRELFRVSLLCRVVHVRVPPRTSLHVFSEFGPRENRVLELVVHLVGDRDVVEDLRGAVVVWPLRDR